MRELQALFEMSGLLVREIRVVHDYIQVNFFDGTVLNLYNEAFVDGKPITRNSDADSWLSQLSGRVVRKVDFNDSLFTLLLQPDAVLTMSLHDAAWTSPEALAMFRPGEPPVVLTEP